MGLAAGLVLAAVSAGHERRPLPALTGLPSLPAAAQSAVSTALGSARLDYRRGLDVRVQGGVTRNVVSADALTPQGPGLAAADGDGRSGLGRAVALSADGSTALVGGPDDGGTGAAWMFTHSAGGWAQQGPKLVTNAGHGQFGYGVALSADGGTALIGDTGSAWVFTARARRGRNRARL